VGRRAADVVDLLVTVGELGRSIGEEALRIGFAPQNVYMMADDQQAVDFLAESLRMNDLVLVKGSRAIGMDVVVTKIITNGEVAHIK